MRDEYTNGAGKRFKSTGIWRSPRAGEYFVGNMSGRVLRAESYMSNRGARLIVEPIPTEDRQDTFRCYIRDGGAISFRRVNTPSRGLFTGEIANAVLNANPSADSVLVATPSGANIYNVVRDSPRLEQV